MCVCVCEVTARHSLATAMGALCSEKLSRMFPQVHLLAKRIPTYPMTVNTTVHSRMVTATSKRAPIIVYAAKKKNEQCGVGTTRRTRCLVGLRSSAFIGRTLKWHRKATPVDRERASERDKDQPPRNMNKKKNTIEGMNVKFVTEYGEC